MGVLSNRNHRVSSKGGCRAIDIKVKSPSTPRTASHQWGGIMRADPPPPRAKSQLLISSHFRIFADRTVPPPTTPQIHPATPGGRPRLVDAFRRLLADRDKDVAEWEALAPAPPLATRHSPRCNSYVHFKIKQKRRLKVIRYN